MKKQSWWLFTLFLVVMIIVFPLNACSNSTSTVSTSPSTAATTTAAPKELKIGFSAMLSGAGSESETRKVVGVEGAADYVNNNGGININGQKYLIKILKEDSKGTPEGGLAAANKLIYEDKVQYICMDDLPYIASGETQLTEKEGVLALVGINTGMPDEMNAKKPLTFALQSLIVHIPPAVDYLVSTYPNVKTVAIAAPNAPDALNFQAIHKAELERRGLKVVSQETFEMGASDYYPMLTKMMAAKPDAIGGGPGFWSWWASILKQARELGFTGPMYMATVGGDPNSLRDAVGSKDAADNFFICSTDINSPLMPAMVTQTIAPKMKDYTKQSFQIEHIDGWSWILTLKQGFESAKSIDPKQVAKAFETMQSIDYPLGTARWGGLKTFGANHVLISPVPITRLVKGNVEMVKWYTPELP